MTTLDQPNDDFDSVAKKRELILTILFIIEVILIRLIRTPNLWNFQLFAFGDPGSNLIFHNLTARGLRPTVDFGYAYGMLSPLVGEAWFRLFGKTHSAYLELTLICNILMAWGVARIAAALRLGAIGIALIVGAMPFAIVVGYPMLSTAFEPVLLCHALAEQSKSRRSRALVLATTALFVKPSMAYFYGLALLITMIVENRGVRSLRFWKGLLPASAIAVFWSIVLISAYGLEPVFNSFLPTVGARIYRLNHNGFFFGQGRDFWRPQGARLGYYLGTTAGFWIAGSILLLFGAVYSLLRLLNLETKNKSSIINYEIIITCAFLHASFVCLFFPNAWGWFHYTYMLVIGVATISTLRGVWSIAAASLIPIAIMGNYADIGQSLKSRKAMSPREELGGLWTYTKEFEEWKKARELARGKRSVVLVQSGAIELMFSEFQPPVTYYFEWGLATRNDLDRKLRQLDGADLVAITKLKTYEDFLQKWPSLREKLDSSFEKSWSGEYVEVYTRKRN